MTCTFFPAHTGVNLCLASVQNRKFFRLLFAAFRSRLSSRVTSSMNTTWAVVKIKPEKNTSAVLIQLS